MLNVSVGVQKQEIHLRVDWACTDIILECAVQVVWEGLGLEQLVVWERD